MKAVRAAEHFASNEGHVGVRHVLRDDAELMNKVLIKAKSLGVDYNCFDGNSSVRNCFQYEILIL